MKLVPITQQEDKTNELYASADCQMLFAMHDDFYPKIGYNFPWVGYFIVSN
jgi:[ribosomal protein S5]-alanine N-acetyltransferase